MILIMMDKPKHGKTSKGMRDFPDSSSSRIYFTVYGLVYLLAEN